MAPDPGGDGAFNLLLVLSPSHLVSGTRPERHNILGRNTPCLNVVGGNTLRDRTRYLNRNEHIAAVLR